MKPLGYITRLALIALSISSCGTDDDLNKFTPDDLTGGTWSTPCVLKGAEYERQTLTFTTTTMTYQRDIFLDDFCLDKIVTLELVYDMTIPAESEYNTPVPVDLTATAVNYIISEAGVASSMNENASCDKTDWAVDTPADISGCTDITAWEKGQVFFLTIEANDDSSRLKFSEGDAVNDGKTAATRATDLGTQYQFSP